MIYFFIFMIVASIREAHNIEQENQTSMTNVFKGAHFGSMFQLDNAVGVLVKDHTLYIEGYGEECYSDEGIPKTLSGNLKKRYTIVSKYIKPINGYRLQQKAEKFSKNYVVIKDTLTQNDIEIAYKEGYIDSREE